MTPTARAVFAPESSGGATAVRPIAPTSVINNSPPESWVREYSAVIARGNAFQTAHLDAAVMNVTNAH